MRRMRFLGAAAMAVLVTVPTAEARAPRPADTVLRNGYVYTVDARDSVRQAVAVRRGRIVYVGSNRGVRRFIGSRTVVRNARGRMIMPGLHDGHMHPLAGGAGLLQVLPRLPAAHVAEFKTRIAKCLSDTADDEPDTWLPGDQLVPGGDGPAPGTKVSKEDLDALSTKRPIVVQSSFGHSTVVNSRGARARGDHRRDARSRGREDLARRRRQPDRPARRRGAGPRRRRRARAHRRRERGQRPRRAGRHAPAGHHVVPRRRPRARPRWRRSPRVQRQGKLTARAHFAPVIDIEAGKNPGKVVQRPARDAAPLRPGRDQAAAVDHAAQRQAVHGRRAAGAGPDGRRPEPVPDQRRARPTRPAGFPARPAARSTSRPRS